MMWVGVGVMRVLGFVVFFFFLMEEVFYDYGTPFSRVNHNN